MMIHQIEILENILSRLPAKSIGRFRCVSKPWRSLLSQPHFIHAHLDRAKHLSTEKQSFLFVSNQSHSLNSIHLRSVDETATVLLPNRLDCGDHWFSSDTVAEHVGSCDGLVLVKDDDDKLLLVNPTTREVKELPAAPCALKQDGTVIMHMYGLGYDSFTDDHKLLSLSYYNQYFYYYYGEEGYESDDSYCGDSDSKPTDTSVCVYSVKNGTWKRLDTSSPYEHNVARNGSGVFINGNIHFIASETSVPNLSLIVAFDLEKEEFVEVPPPTSDDCQNFVFGRLAMARGCLCLMPSRGEGQTIFMMKEYGVKDSWTKFTALDYENSSIRSLSSLGKDEMVLLIDDDTPSEKLMIYNLEEGRSEDVLVQGVGDEYWVVGTFIESLVSPHCICSNKGANEE